MRQIVPVGAYILGFWVLFQAGGAFTVAPNISAFYPAPALSIAFIAIYGIRYAPAVFVAAALGSFPYHGFWDYAPQEWWQCARQAVVYSLAGHVLRHRLGVPPIPKASREVFGLLCVAVLSALLSAALAVLIFWRFSFFPADALLLVFFSFWAGDAAGVIMALPLLYRLVFELNSRSVGDVARMALPRSALFYARAVVLPMAFSGLCFGALMLGGAGHDYGYLIVLPVVWLAATEGLIGGALAALAANIGAAAIYGLNGGDAYPALALHTLFAVTAAIGLVVGIAFDERRAADEERRLKDQEVARLSRASTVDALGATIAHEIATPLQIALVNVQLEADLLEQGRPEDLPRISTYNARVKAAVETAARIHKRIQMILRGGGKAPAPMRLGEAVRAAIDLMAGDVARAGASLEARMGDTDPWVLADPIDIQQIVINLIRNAQQAVGESGRKTRRIVVELRSTADSAVEISVADTGPGLPPGDIETLFSSFYSTRQDGLGLGLSICRDIAHGYGGSLTAENTTEGARFTIRLPELERAHDG